MTMATTTTATLPITTRRIIPAPLRRRTVRILIGEMCTHKTEHNSSELDRFEALNCQFRYKRARCCSDLYQHRIDFVRALRLTPQTHHMTPDNPSLYSRTVS